MNFVRNRQFEAAAARLERAAELSPRNVAVRRNLGDTYYMLHRYEEAIQQYNEAMRYDPAYARDGSVKCGNAYERLGRYTEAIGAFERALNLDPGFVAVRLELGKLYTQVGRPADAYRHMARAVAQLPGFSPALNGLGIALATMGRHNEALDAFLRALALDPNNTMAMHNIGLQYTKLGWNKKAEKKFQTVIKKAPGYLPAYFALGAVYEKTGEADKEAKCYQEAAARDAKSPVPHLRMAELYIRQNKWDKALEEAKKAQSLIGGAARSPIALGLRLVFGKIYRHQGKRKEAIREFESAIQMWPSAIDAARALAELYEAQGKKDVAKRYREKAQTLQKEKKKKDDIAAAYFGGIASMRTGDMKGASANFAKVVKLNPTYVDATYLYAHTLAAQGLYKQALSQLDHALSKDSSFSKALFERARIKAKEGKKDDAIADYRAGLRNAPYDRTVHMELAKLLESAGKMAEAIDEYRAVLALSPGERSALVMVRDAYKRAGQSEQVERYNKIIATFDKNEAERAKKLAEKKAKPPHAAPPKPKTKVGSQSKNTHKKKPASR